MENNVFKVVLLQALPASGKSEVRNFMANIEPERLKKEFHIGENLQLDDFPYVHMMRRIDNELEAMGQARLFYPGEEPFIDGRDWGTLCCLLNEDYHDLLNRNVQSPIPARSCFLIVTTEPVRSSALHRGSESSRKKSAKNWRKSWKPRRPPC